MFLDAWKYIMTRRRFLNKGVFLEIYHQINEDKREMILKDNSSSNGLVDTTTVTPHQVRLFTPI